MVVLRVRNPEIGLGHLNTDGIIGKGGPELKGKSCGSHLDGIGYTKGRFLLDKKHGNGYNYASFFPAPYSI